MESLDNFKVFYEVAKAGNITKASEKLFISQPAVSQTIKKLEEDLSTTLFIRNKKGVQLTKIGQEIFKKVEVAMLSLMSAEKFIGESNQLKGGCVVIGSGSNIARESLSLPIKKLLKEFPKVQIIQIEDVQKNMLEKLKKGEVDVVISQKNEDAANCEDLRFCELFNHKYIFIKKKGSEVERFIKLSKGSYTNGLFEEFERKNHFQKLPEIVVTGYRMAIELVKQGLGVALVPETLVSELLKKNEIEVIFQNYKLPTITFGYYFNPLSLTPATEVFVKFLEQ